MSWEKVIKNSLVKEDVNKQVLELEGYLEDNKAKYWLYKFLKENITIHYRIVNWYRIVSISTYGCKGHDGK